MNSSLELLVFASLALSACASSPEADMLDDMPEFIMLDAPDAATLAKSDDGDSDLDKAKIVKGTAWTGSLGEYTAEVWQDEAGTTWGNWVLDYTDSLYPEYGIYMDMDVDCALFLDDHTVLVTGVVQDSDLFPGPIGHTMIHWMVDNGSDPDVFGPYWVYFGGPPVEDACQLFAPGAPYEGLVDVLQPGGTSGYNFTFGSGNIKVKDVWGGDEE